MAIVFQRKIIIIGAVQGVGFRPFVYKLAQQFGLFGEVYNDSSGVVVVIQDTPPEKLDEFLLSLRKNAPKLATIIDVIIEDGLQVARAYDDFTISQSQSQSQSSRGRASTLVLPDVCVCDDCVSDISSKTNLRYNYPFTNCTNCGPRFSIVKGLPYDRKSTSMSVFPMCRQCKQEYQNPLDRRFHAQPNACADCGPQLQLTDSAGKTIVTNSVIEEAASLLKRGKILAIKGIGGFHLACLASSESIIKTLRIKKHRKHKPFALMAKDISMVKEFCLVSESEKHLLVDRASPIVLLEKSNNLLSKNIAPKQKNLGFMLPYSPLHYLLLQQLVEPLVLTSGNKSNNPQIIDNQRALQDLSNVADYFLLHNRDIVNRVDDSVVQHAAGDVRVMRRARGYAPTWLPLPKGFEGFSGLLAVGAELKNTFCLFSDSQAIVSQHIGDLSTLESYQDFKANISLYQQLYETDIKHLACDYHPNYLSTKFAIDYAQDNSIKLNKVYHHHAHIAACLFEHGKNLNCDQVLGVVWDGIGLGDDGSLWGGEFLLADYCGFQRLAKFEHVLLIGGDKAAKEPWRMAYAYLKKHQLCDARFFSGKPFKEMDAVLASDIPINKTSSVGRLFDAVAYMLGICDERITYEAQAAIELESLASECIQTPCHQPYSFEFQMADGCYSIDTKKMWLEIIEDINNNVERSNIAYRFHLFLAKLLIKSVLKIKQDNPFITVILSGGVFNNKLLLELVHKLFDNMADLTLLLPSLIPSGDGGICLGQAAVCVAREKKYGQ